MEGKYIWVGKKIIGRNYGESIIYYGLGEDDFKKFFDGYPNKIAEAWEGTFEQIEHLANLRDMRTPWEPRKKAMEKILKNMKKIYPEKKGEE